MLLKMAIEIAIELLNIFLVGGLDSGFNKKLLNMAQSK
jgi:hypothetical protein